MTTLIVPDDGQVLWPTLGWGVAEFLTGWDYLNERESDKYEGSVFGPGSLKGLKYKLDNEKLGCILRAYEVYPREHKYAGRRRFKRVAISWRKGTAKTEWAAQIAYAELHPLAPVRFMDWQQDKYGDWIPIGRPVRDPYIPMMAYTEDQTEELAYGALQVIVREGPDADLFDVGNDRILRLANGRPDGKVQAVASSPNANDGARTTFQHFDETHRLELPRHIASHKTMLANIPKRPLDDPWSLETTTAGRPGGGSVAEGTHSYAELIAQGRKREPRLFYFHREASAQWNMDKFEDRVKAIAEATGPVGEYAPGQFEEIAEQWEEPDADKAYLERVWCNRWTQAARQAFDVKRFETLGVLRFGQRIPKRTLVTAGFDGARFKDSTGFVVTDIVSGFQVPYALWENPGDNDQWEVPIDEVHEVFEEIMRDYRVWKLYPDPPHYVEDVGKWAGKYPDQVEEWWTNRRRPMAQAIRNYTEAMTGGQLTHNGDPDYIRHVGNAGKVETTLLDENGQKIYILGKLRPEAKFDLCMAGILSWQARLDALAAGVVPEKTFVPYRLK